MLFFFSVFGLVLLYNATLGVFTCHIIIVAVVEQTSDQTNKKEKLIARHTKNSDDWRLMMIIVVLMMTTNQPTNQKPTYLPYRQINQRSTQSYQPTHQKKIHLIEEKKCVFFCNKNILPLLSGFFGFLASWLLLSIFFSVSLFFIKFFLWIFFRVQFVRFWCYSMISCYFPLIAKQTRHNFFPSSFVCCCCRRRPRLHLIR